MATSNGCTSRQRALAIKFIGSGLTRKDFSTREQIPLSTLDYWLRKIRNGKRTSPVRHDRGPLFIPLTAGQVPREDDRFEIQVPDGCRIFVPRSVSVDEIIRLIQGTATYAS